MGKSYQRRYALIALPVPVRKLFTYAVPDGLKGCALPGCRARVPFGKRSMTGAIILLTDEPGMEAGKIRPIESLPDGEAVIQRGLLETLEWAARYYVAAPGAVISMALPPSAGRAPRTRAFYSAAEPCEAELTAVARAPRQREILSMLRAEGVPVPADRIRGNLGNVTSALGALKSKGLVTVERRQIVSRPELPSSPSPVERHTLTS